MWLLKLSDFATGEREKSGVNSKAQLEQLYGSCSSYIFQLGQLMGAAL